MKKISLIATLLSFACFNVFGQDDWEGAWHGKIEMANLRLVFNIKNAGSGTILATMDSPDQSAFGIVLESASVAGDSIFINDARFSISFTGKKINDSTINGVFTQGMEIPLVLKRSSTGATASKPTIKKQTPVPPFPYKSEEVTFENTKAGIKLSGTLTIPKETNGKGYPAVVLISGSGPQDRDETLMGHKPFAVIADHLTRLGMMVLRYDDRGTGSSTGDFSSATSLDFKTDAEAAVHFLSKRKDVDLKKIGLLGHSEGGLIAPLVANENKNVNFIILLAGPGVPVSQLMREQNVSILKRQGVDTGAADAYGKLYSDVISIVRSSTPHEEKIDKVMDVARGWEKEQPSGRAKALGLHGEQWQKNFAQQMVDQTSGKWMQYFLNYDPQPALKKLKIKVLALNGDKDSQVVGESNLAAIETALEQSGSPAYKVVSLPGLNHLFQNCTTCTVAEYGALEETISPAALSEISTWLKEENIFRK